MKNTNADGTFLPNKTATELGIDLKRKFVVVKKSAHSPEIGDILEIIRDDGSDYLSFWNLTADRWGSNHKHETENKWKCVAEWSQLKYYDEPSKIILEKDGVINYTPPMPCPTLIGSDISIRYSLLTNENNYNPTASKPEENKIMSIVKNAFKSKESKALEHFGLGSTNELTEEGRREFIDYIFETGEIDKKGFLAKIVEAYKEAKNK